MWNGWIQMISAWHDQMCFELWSVVLACILHGGYDASWYHLNFTSVILMCLTGPCVTT